MPTRYDPPSFVEEPHARRELETYTSADSQYPRDAFIARILSRRECKPTRGKVVWSETGAFGKMLKPFGCGVCVFRFP